MEKVLVSREDVERRETTPWAPPLLPSSTGPIERTAISLEPTTYIHSSLSSHFQVKKLRLGEVE